MDIPVYIGTSEKLNNIRCVKAARNIKKGELIESCPVILIPAKENEFVEKTVFDNYVYEWNKNSDCFVLGYCILTNHSYEPNAVYKRNYKLEKMEYYALVDIKKDEDININYNGNPHDLTALDPAHTDFSH